MPSQNLAKTELKTSLKLSFRIQDTSSTWDTFWLLYSRPTMLPSLVICEVDPTIAHTTCALSTPYAVLSWYLLPEGFLHLSPLPTLCLCVTQSDPKSADLIKYSYWTEYFSWLCFSVDPNIHWITCRVDTWPNFSKRFRLAEMPLGDTVLSKNTPWQVTFSLVLYNNWVRIPGSLTWYNLKTKSFVYHLLHLWEMYSCLRLSHFFNTSVFQYNPLYKDSNKMLLKHFCFNSGILKLGQHKTKKKKNL